MTADRFTDHLADHLANVSDEEVIAGASKMAISLFLSGFAAGAASAFASATTMGDDEACAKADQMVKAVRASPEASSVLAAEIAGIMSDRPTKERQDAIDVPVQGFGVN